MANESGSQTDLMSSLMGLLGNNLGKTLGVGEGGGAGSGEGGDVLRQKITDLALGLMGGTSRRRMQRTLRGVVAELATNWMLNAMPGFLTGASAAGNSVPVVAEAAKPAQIPARTTGATSRAHYSSGSKVFYIPSASRDGGRSDLGGTRYWA